MATVKNKKAAKKRVPKDKTRKRHWNHRVLAVNNPPSFPPGVSLVIHTVYYENDKPISYGEPPPTIAGEELSELDYTLRMMRLCIEKPILWHGERFPEEYKPEDNEVSK